MDYAEVPGRQDQVIRTAKINVTSTMDRLRIIACESCAAGDTTRFWQTSNILLINPHTINRRIAVSAELVLYELESSREKVSDVLGTLDFALAEDQQIETDILKRFEDLLNVRKVKLPVFELQTNKKYLRIAKLLPRDPVKFTTTLEIAIIDRNENHLTYYHCILGKGKRSLGVDFVYRLSWNSNCEVGLWTEETPEANLIWLKDQLFPKFVKWMTNDAPGSFISGSLNLVKSEKYVTLYDELKKKYGLEMVKIWPENTDPLKFVYEDVAIATYLILLWEEERKITGQDKLQKFVDLGCGNGLLVHILASEGYPGFGIDLRRRKIWDMFPSSTKLEVRTIVPSFLNLFPDTDWVIGNHSDELTPWIPVIAARSSYKCRFFLLPCCAYEFDGTKYQRNDSSLSQYHEYMNYVQTISETCGFETLVDKLRIPSTKRICFIGSRRTYAESEHINQDIKIQEIIHKKSSGKQTEPWSSDFKPRDIVEKVRNCTKIDKELVTDIIKLIVEGLLKECHLVNVSGKNWNAGGALGIRDAVELLQADQLKELKNECGGLQTLLKNNGHIFRVVEGKVRLKLPSENGPLNKKSKRKKFTIIRKQKPCWFYDNHPDGCPFSDEECTFKHKEDL